MRVPVDAEHGEWVRRARQGEVEAFCRLVEAYQVPVFNLCRRMLGDELEAEDAAQEAFLRAYRSLKRYDVNRPFGTWLLAIASHRCIDLLRHRRRHPELAAQSTTDSRDPDPCDDPENGLIRAQHQDLIDSLTQTLAPKERAVIVLRYWYDLSYGEIAAALSLSVSAVKTRLHRARRTLARRWLDAMGEQSEVREVMHEPSAV